MNNTTEQTTAPSGGRLAVLLLLVIILTTPVQAITLKDAQQMARHHSEQSQIISSQRLADDADARRTTAFARPQLDGYASWFHIDSNASNPFIPTPNREVTIGVQASQLLFAGGRIWQSAHLRDNLQQLAAYSEQSAWGDLDRDVALAFIDVQRQQEIKQIAADRVQQRQEELADAQAKFSVGTAPQLDVREAQMVLTQAQNDLQEAESDLFVTMTTFNRLLGRLPSVDLLGPETALTSPENFALSLQQLTSQLEERMQIDLRTIATSEQANQRQQTMAAGEFWPTLTLAANGEGESDHHDDLDETWTVGVRLDWNFLNGGETKNTYAKARAQAQQATAQHQKTYKHLVTSLTNLSRQHDDLVEEIARQKEAVVLAESNYEDARALYNEGLITLTHLGQYNLAYAENRFGLTQLLYSDNRLYYELLRLTHQE
nr:TolC family protein [uncultured Desulfuromonas sp.]